MAQEPQILFLQMPWGPTRRPAISFGILTQLCSQAGVRSATWYPNLDLAAVVGLELANLFAEERTLFGLSEHFFAADLFGAEPLESDRFLEIIAKVGGVPAPLNDCPYLKNLRDRVVPEFLDRLTDRVLNEKPTAVGFSSPFNQVMSSLALARRIKKRAPHVQILCGGACFDGEMGNEYHRALPDVIDHVFMGEAEDSFREYLRRHRAAEPTRGIPGVTFGDGQEVKLVPGKKLGDLNESPVPDYDDFFVEKARVERQMGTRWHIDFLPFESSRGCWWGQKNHCMFCGINGELMGFRAKSTDRVLEEVLHLSRRYRVTKFTATDWIISHEHRRKLAEKLVPLQLDVEFFYETRSDVSKLELARLVDAGFSELQPGIESLSTPLLQLMRKGTTAIRQVQFLRWAREYNVKLSYNLLAGFPGEQSSWYLDMAGLIEKLGHLQPPLCNLHFVEMHRFSPLFTRREEWGVKDYAIRKDYRFNFPPGLLDPLKVGYAFEFSADTLAPQAEYVDAVTQVIDRWLVAHASPKPPVFEYRLGPDFVDVRDTRGSTERAFTLTGLARDALLLADEVRSRTSFLGELRALHPTATDIEQTVDELIRLDLLMEENQHLLALPIGHRPHSTEELRRYVYEEGDQPRAVGYAAERISPTTSAN